MMARRRWLILAATILLAATALRTAWLRADPPNTSVGIVWHDEGAWVHNARNAALWGTWRTDNWNPCVHRTGVHGAGIRRVQGIWRRHLAGAHGACGLGPSRNHRAHGRVARGDQTARRAHRAHRWRSAGGQLHVGGLESSSAHGIHDDDVHRRRVGGLRAGRPPAGVGCRRRHCRGAGVLHQSCGGVLHRGDRAGCRLDDRSGPRRARANATAH